MYYVGYFFFFLLNKKKLGYEFTPRRDMYILDVDVEPRVRANFGKTGLYTINAISSNAY